MSCKFSVDASELKKALKLIKSLISVKESDLAVLFDVRKESIQLKAGYYGTWLELNLKASSSGEDQFILPISSLLKMKFPETTLTLALEEKALKFRAGKFRGSFPLLALESSVEEDTKNLLNQETTNYSLQRVLEFAPKDSIELRNVLNLDLLKGLKMLAFSPLVSTLDKPIKIIAKNNVVTLSSNDDYKGAYFKFELDQIEDLDLTVSYKMLSAILAGFSIFPDTEIRFGFSEKAIRFKNESIDYCFPLQGIKTRDVSAAIAKYLKLDPKVSFAVDSKLLKDAFTSVCSTLDAVSRKSREKFLTLTLIKGKMHKKVPEDKDILKISSELNSSQLQYSLLVDNGTGEGSTILSDRVLDGMLPLGLIQLNFYEKFLIISSLDSEYKALLTRMAEKSLSSS